MSYQATPTKILCGVAASCDDAHQLHLCKADANAAKHVVRLAAKLKASVRFVHVLDFMDLESAPTGDPVSETVRVALASDVNALLADAQAQGVEASQVMREGKPWSELIREAEAWGAELIAISPRREELSIGQRLLHGSTATRVLRGATQPVWIVESRLSRVRKVMALVDRTEISARVVATTAALADAYGAERYVLNCLDYPDDIVLHRLPNAHKAVLHHHQDVKARAKADLEALTAGDPAWTILLDDEWVVRRAPHIVDQEQIDLVVLGSAAQSRIRGALLGTTAERLLERCYVSAWVARPEGWTRQLDID